MSCKLICIDMDGTLLNDEKTINEENLKAIKMAHEKGVKIAVCTGRLFASAKYYGELIGVKAPIIASNGAYIREKDEEKIIYKLELGKKNCKQIQDIIGKYNLQVYYNTSDSIIATNGFPKDYNYAVMNEKLTEKFKVELIDAKDIYSSLGEKGDDVFKCICISKDIVEIDKARKELMELNEFEIVSSGSDNIEIMHRGVSKGKAVQVLAEFYNIKQDEIMCIGDNENDLSMIKYAGMGVAMGNGSKLVKDVAIFVTDTNNNSGVAKAIEKFAL
ncbi:Cof-type HAD-IIB family hydrolase [Clostridium akagii]|uniref:Cof-type HAD-IIB family hydrolase n=1 Tax=Clostridium akagii TaxID=91623 RepID=UPI00047AA573|nr:Cof-type HAD-IIB family hydrolase [Clostridium akagii]